MDSIITSSPDISFSCAAPLLHGPCRLCGVPLKTTVVDLGMSPLANAFIAPEYSNSMEPFYPLHLMICDDCHLVQLEEFETPQKIFDNYLYYSSYSTSWLRHAEIYVEKQIERFNLNSKSLIVEIASNDGYLLQYAQNNGIPSLGVEPSLTVAEIAIKKGIKTEVFFFGKETAKKLKNRGYYADLMVANNVLAHVPDIHDFVEGFKILLKPEGVATFEFPHLMKMLEETQFDTIYHEHFSYLSLGIVKKAFGLHGLRVFDVEELTTHGGSLRVYVTHEESKKHTQCNSVVEMLGRENESGLGNIKTYQEFARRVICIKEDFLEFLIAERRSGHKVVAYGAPAKGNTLLNYCGVKKEYIDFTTDLNPHKQEMLLPGSRIPILPPDEIKNYKPDIVVILPWNLKDEIMDQLKFIREWGGKFVINIPNLAIL